MGSDDPPGKMDELLQPFNGLFSRTTWVSRYQIGKTNLDLLEQETVSGSGISWAICKSARRSRQITTPVPHHSVFTGRMPFLPPNQQRQSTEGTEAGSEVEENDFGAFCARKLTFGDRI